MIKKDTSPARGPRRGGPDHSAPRHHGGGRGRATGGHRAPVRHAGQPSHHAGPVGRPNFTESRRQQKFRGVARGHAPRPEKRERRDDVLRFIPLGGLEEIGRNCSFFEYKNEIVISDVGIQFPEEDTPGVDYIIPNVAYLEEHKQKIAGIILTHGHYDHIAAIHYLVERLGNPIIYTSRFTRGIVERRHEEFVNAPKLRFHTIEPGSRVRISEHFTAEFFAIEHTIPEAYGFILDTPVGKMVSFGDFRLDYDDKGNPRNIGIFDRLGEMGIHSIFMDSTNADVAGRMISEDEVTANLEALVKGANGRVIVALFASLVDRILEIIKIAHKLGRKVAVNGRSMKSNLEIAKDLGYMKDIKGQMINLEEINKHKDDKILILTTGTQGEANAGLMRIVNGEHPLVQLKTTDTVIFSSSVIPGNERSVQALQDNIARQVDELYNSKLLDIHVSGHCHREDVKLVMERVKPKFVVPIHGYYFKRKSVLKTAEAAGLKRDQVILMDNGQVGEIDADTFTVTGETVPAFYVMVDGLGVGDVEEVVLRDRRSLAQEGMVVVIITVDRRTGRLLKNPDIISRGFIFMKDNHEILDEIRKRIRSLITRLPNYQEVESDYLKGLIRDQVGQYLYNKTKRRPMLLPVLIEI